MTLNPVQQKLAEIRSRGQATTTQESGLNPVQLKLQEIRTQKTQASAAPKPEAKKSVLSNIWDFGKEAVKEGIYRPIAKTAVTGLAPVVDVANLAMGNKDAQFRSQTGFDVPGLGQVKPVGAYNEQKTLGENLESGVRDIVGTGIGVGSMLVGGEGQAFGKSLALKGVEKFAPKAIPTATKILSAGKGLVPRIGESVAIGETMNVGQNIQEGKPLFENALGVGALSAAIPGAGTALSSIKAKVAPNAASALINTLIKPLKKNFAYGKNPGLAVAKEGLTATSLEELAPKISERLNEVGQLKQQILSSPEYKNKRVTTLYDALIPLGNALKVAEKAPSTNSSLITRIKGVIDDLSMLQSGEERAPRDLKNVLIKDADLFKQEIGSLTKYTGNASDDSVINRALQEAYSTVKRKIEALVPEIKPVNTRYGDLLEAGIATRYRDVITQRQNLLSLPTRLAGYGGAIASSALGGDIRPLLGAIAVGSIDAALSSALVRTHLASWLAKAPIKEIVERLAEQPFTLRNGIIRIFGKEESLREKIDAIKGIKIKKEIKLPKGEAAATP